MWKISNFLLLFLFLPSVYSQFALQPKVRVEPKCGTQLITVEVSFNKDLLPGGKFTDWIVVGISGRPECRLKGNGEIRYVIEIAIFNDPCNTLMPQVGIFENRVRIGENPSVILAGDETFRIRCVYGRPEIGTLPLPIINPNFAIDNGASGTNLFGQQSINEGLLSTVRQPIQPSIGANGELTAEQLAAINRQLLENARGSGSPSILANGNSNLGFPSGFGGLLNNTGKSGGERPNPLNNRGNLDGDFREDPLLNINPQGGIKSGLDIRPINPNTGLSTDLSSINANLNAVTGGQPGMQANTASSRLPQILLFALLSFLLLALVLLCCLYFCMRRRHQEDQQNNNMRVSMPASKGFGGMWWTGRANPANGEYAGLESTRHGSAGSPANSGTSSTHAASSQQAVLPRKHFEKNKRSFGYDGAITAFDRRGSSDSQSRADYLPTNSLGIASISNRETNNGYASTRKVNRAFVSDLGDENHYASGSYLSTRSPPPRESPPPAPMEKDYQVTRSGTNYVEHYVSETEHNNPDFNERAVDVAEVSKNISRDRYDKIDQSIVELQKVQPKSYSEWRRTLMDGREEHPERPASSTGVQVSSREVPAGLFPEEGISSFRSITEIYQSVETRRDDFAREQESIQDSQSTIDQLCDAVLPMRGFGPRKLNEQELGRWRGLIRRDPRLRELLLACKNIGDVLSVSERAEYRTLFTREKWGEIARCLADSAIIKTNLGTQRSNSNLNIYVGNVGTDW
ncbi:unnamed protein product, partial [Mesorhabditis belari]|uniref:Uncharacterized protein n=1 Tax=Mesorhabditis belari TaxID=2138241 RepID=A0AAF3EYY8_9BILA